MAGNSTDGDGGQNSVAAGATGSGAPTSKKPSALIDLKATAVEVREVKPTPKEAAPTSATPQVPRLETPKLETLVPPPAQPPTAAEVLRSRTAPAGTTDADRQAGDRPAGGSDPQRTKPLPASAYIRSADEADVQVRPSGAADTKAAAQRGDGPGTSGSANDQRLSTRATPSQAGSATSQSTGGLRGAATHLAAGLAGGLLALLGADAIGSTIGQPLGEALGLSPGQSQTGQSRPGQSRSIEQTEVERRLQALEGGLARAPQSDGDSVQQLADKLAAAQTRLARLDELDGTVKTLAEQQAKLSRDTAATSEKVGRLAPGGDAAARIAKLEEELSALSTAATDDPQHRVPQLAAVNRRLGEFDTQLAALRKSLTQELSTRVAQASEAGEAARTGVQRIDKGLAGLKSTTDQLADRVDTVKTEVDRSLAGVRSLKEQAETFKTAVDDVKGEMLRELARVARPGDVSSAVSPVVSRLAALEQNVQGVVKGEDERRANAGRILLALDLGNLKRAIDRGAPYVAELAEVRRVAGSSLDLAALDASRERGIAPVAALAREFHGLAYSIIAADARPANPSWTERLVASARSVVRVRRIDQAPDDSSVEATVARIETALGADRLDDALTEAGKLPHGALAPAQAWLAKLQARVQVERAIGEIERQLKSALSAARSGSSGPVGEPEGPALDGKRG